MQLDSDKLERKFGYWTIFVNIGYWKLYEK